MALLLGILLGIAIGDKGLVSGAARDVRKQLEGDVRSARADADSLRAELAQRDLLDADLYPLIVQGRLTGNRVGIVAVGQLSDRTIGLVRDALKDTGGRLTLEAVLRTPPQLDGLSPRDTGVRGHPISADPHAVTRFGRIFGSQLTRGGGVAKRTQRTVFSTSSGSLNGVEAVVVVRDSPPVLRGPDATLERNLENGLLRGLTANNIPVVGVETTSTTPSQVPWYRLHNVSSVDDLDKLAGRVALVFALAGANGAFGIKPSAQALLPKAASGVGAG
jgi:hypothetical protein